MNYPALDKPNLRENYTENGEPEGGSTVTTKIADDKSIQTKGPQKEDKANI